MLISRLLQAPKAATQRALHELIPGVRMLLNPEPEEIKEVTETVPHDQPIWLVSDLHLGDGTPSDAFFGKDRHLMALVRRVEREGAILVINGDALDVQQAWTLTRIPILRKSPASRYQHTF